MKEKEDKTKNLKKKDQNVSMTEKDNTSPERYMRHIRNLSFRKKKISNTSKNIPANKVEVKASQINLGHEIERSPLRCHRSLHTKNSKLEIKFNGKK